LQLNKPLRGRLTKVASLPAARPAVQLSTPPQARTLGQSPRRRHKLALCRNLLGSEAGHTVSNQPLPRDYKSLYETITGESLVHCPACRAGTMKLTVRLAPLASLVYCAPHSHLTTDSFNQKPQSHACPTVKRH